MGKKGKLVIVATISMLILLTFVGCVQGPGKTAAVNMNAAVQLRDASRLFGYAEYDLTINLTGSAATVAVMAGNELLAQVKAEAVMNLPSLLVDLETETIAIVAKDAKGASLATIQVKLDSHQRSMLWNREAVDLEGLYFYDDEEEMWMFYSMAMIRKMTREDRRELNLLSKESSKPRYFVTDLEGEWQFCDVDDFELKGFDADFEPLEDAEDFPHKVRDVENQKMIDPKNPDEPYYQLEIAVGADGTGGTVEGAGWYKEDDPVRIKATPDEGFLFEKWTEADGTPKIGWEDEVDFDMPPEDLKLVAWFVPIAAPEVVAVDEPEGIEVELGTAFEDLELPEEVGVELDNGDFIDVAVIWEEGDYDADAPGEYELEGELQLPLGVVNPLGLTAKITVTVLPAPWYGEYEIFLKDTVDVMFKLWEYDVRLKTNPEMAIEKVVMDNAFPAKKQGLVVGNEVRVVGRVRDADEDVQMVAFGEDDVLIGGVLPIPAPRHAIEDHGTWEFKHQLNIAGKVLNVFEVRFEGNNPYVDSLRIEGDKMADVEIEDHYIWQVEADGDGWFAQGEVVLEEGTAKVEIYALNQLGNKFGYPREYTDLPY